MYDPQPLREVYEEAVQQVYRGLEERSKVKVLSEAEREKLSGKVAPCIQYILSELPAKSEKVNFNKLTMNLVTYFQMAGYSKEDAWTSAQPFVDNYPHSDTYNTAKRRQQHWHTEWDYLASNQDYNFNCSYVKGLGFPGSAFDCIGCHFDIIGADKQDISTVSEKILEFVRMDEDGDAQLFIELHQGQFCYDHAAGIWYRWAGNYWEIDDLDEATAGIKTIIQRYAATALYFGLLKIKAKKDGRSEQADEHKKKEKMLLTRIGQLHKAKRKANVLHLAKVGKHSMGISGQGWDRDPMWLGCKNGVINLKTGEFRPGRPDEYIKTATPTQWGGIDAPCARWEVLLMEIFDSNNDLVNYVHRLFGYAITGKTTEHIYPILWGIGRNGKGTLLETLSYVLGELAGPIESEMMLQQRLPKHSGGATSDIMHLRGKRIVWASETGQGRSLNTGKLKWLTGGDTLTGRPPYGKRQVSFSPTHTLFLLTNYKPHAPANDYALWERLHLIPFTLSFVDNPKADYERKADPNLPERLKIEAAGILAWVVKGCLKWQEQGLNPPEIVKAATKDYQADEDIIGHFIDECCVVRDQLQVKAGELYKAYTDWCKEMGHKAMSGTRFGREMKRRFDSYKPKYVFYLGLGLRQDH